MTSRGSILRGALGVAVSLVAIALVLRSVDLAETASVLSAAVPGLLVVMFGAQVSDATLRGLRWQRLLAPVRRVPLARTMDYLLAGYLANNVLPARLGELVRSHYLGDREGVSRTTTLGTVVVERVVDTSMLVVVAAIAIVALGVRGDVANAVLVGLGLAAVLVVGLAVALVAHRLPGSDRVIAALAHRRTLVDLAGNLRGGLAVASDPPTLVAVVLLSLGAWTAATLAVAVAASALGIGLSLAQAALFMSVAALSTAIPSGPGYLGTYELAAVAVGAAIGIPAEQAFALAILVHAGALLVTSVGGLIGLARIFRRPSAPDATLESPDPVGSTAS